jgi:hypothetical protein
MLDCPPGETAEGPIPTRPRAWVLVLGAILGRLLNSLHWALVGGLGWGFGTAVGGMIPFPDAGLIGGVAGLALVLLSVLTTSWHNKRSEFIPIGLAGFGGAAVGSASLLVLNPPLPREVIGLGGGAGLFVGLCTSVMKQYFAPVSVLHAVTSALAGTALLAGIGLLIGGPIGWAAAGAVSLFSLAMFTECLRREPAVLVDEKEQPIRVIPRREMCGHVARESWSFSAPLAWGWNGLFGGLFASLWFSWAADRPGASAVRLPFLVCGSLAALGIIAAHLGILKPARPSGSTRDQSGEARPVPPSH